MKIYSEFEEKRMTQFQNAKDHFFSPLNELLLKIGISANVISFLSGLTAVLSIVLAVNFNSALVFILGIWLHFFLDGLDGSLARKANKKTDGAGLLMDLVPDSLGIIALGIFTFYFSYTSALTSLIFTVAYMVVNTTSYLIAKQNKKQGFVVRPRVYIISSIILDYLYPLLEITSPLMIISNVLLVIFSLTGIYKIIK